MESPNHLIAIMGPTAIGKTKLGVALAQHWETEIISADSRQIYKELTIGTAKPSPEELQQAPHHFIGERSVNNPYNAGQFEKEALQRLQQIYQTNNVAIMVGGSGLYIKALLEGLDDFPKVPPSTRQKVQALYQEKGLAYLQSELRKHDPQYYQEVDRNNPHRLIRALEICYETGRPFSSFRQQKPTPRPFTTIKVGLNMDRQKLHERINQRVDRMIKRGLLEEVKNLYPQRQLKTVKTVGYKELFDYLDDKITFDRALELIKRNTRRFAKRQLTWFRKDDDIQWFHPSQQDEIIRYIERQLQQPAKK